MMTYFIIAVAGLTAGLWLGDWLNRAIIKEQHDLLNMYRANLLLAQEDYLARQVTRP